MENNSIKHWDAADRPREKMQNHGVSCLSNAELLAILLGSGNRQLSAVELARYILDTVGNNLSELGKLSIDDLCKINGIGTAKAITIIAAIELGRRRQKSEAFVRPEIRTSNDIFEYLRPLLCDLNHEEFLVIYMNANNKIIKHEVISKDGSKEQIVDIKYIAKRTIELMSPQIIVAHNHPSGILSPSQYDINWTHQLAETMKIIDTRLLDHIIIADNQYYSFVDQNLL